MNSRFKEFAKTPKGKLVIASCALVLSWIFLLWNFSGTIPFSLPSETRKNNVKQQIRKLHAELQTLEVKFKDAGKVKKRHRAMIDSSWQPARDGDPELIFRQKIENAAKECELKLNSIGTVRTTRINQDFYFAELDISANASFETIVKFIAKIQEQKPVISWRRLSASLMFQRPKTNTQTRTITNAAGNNSETTLVFSANLRVVVYEEQQSAQKENLKKTKNAEQGDTSATPAPPKTDAPGEPGGPPPPGPVNNPDGTPPPPPGEGAAR